MAVLIILLLTLAVLALWYVITHIEITPYADTSAVAGTYFCAIDGDSPCAEDGRLLLGSRADWAWAAAKGLFLLDGKNVTFNPPAASASEDGPHTWGAASFPQTDRLVLRFGEQGWPRAITNHADPAYASAVGTYRCVRVTDANGDVAGECPEVPEFVLTRERWSLGAVEGTYVVAVARGVDNSLIVHFDGEETGPPVWGIPTIWPTDDELIFYQPKVGLATWTRTMGDLTNGTAPPSPEPTSTNETSPTLSSGPTSTPPPNTNTPTRSSTPTQSTPTGTTGPPATGAYDTPESVAGVYTCRTYTEGGSSEDCGDTYGYLTLYGDGTWTMGSIYYGDFSVQGGRVYFTGSYAGPPSWGPYGTAGEGTLAFTKGNESWFWSIGG